MEGISSKISGHRLRIKSLDALKLRTSGQILQVTGLLVALATATQFFFNLIALLIGAALVLFSKSLRWKVHGAVIAFLSGFAALIALRFSSAPPLGVITGIVLGGLGLYALLAGIVWVIQKRGKPAVCHARIVTYLGQVRAHARALQWALVIGGIVLPLGFWSSVHINLGVAFDNQPRMLWLHAPTTPPIATPFQISAQAWDRYERISGSYQGTVAFSLESYDLNSFALMDPALVEASLPDPYTFSGRRARPVMELAYMRRDGNDNGIHTFEVTISTPGIHYLVAREVTNFHGDGGTQIPFEDCLFYSNPIIVYPATAAHSNIYWGDIHTHSNYSDGSGSLEHNAFYARNVANLDFYAVTDHAEILFFNPWKHGSMERFANAVNKPGKFVYFQGVEWTSIRYGHYSLVFNGDKVLRPLELMPGRFGPFSTTERLWRDLNTFTQKTGAMALALPHHTTKVSYPQDWSYLNPQYVRLAEVTSTHGDSLYEQLHPLNYAGGTGIPRDETHGQSITDALLMGHQLTLYAASDAHDGHPGHSLSHTEAAIGHQRPWSTWPTRKGKHYPGGLTAVHADELTREAVFDALYHSRVYASSDHGRPFLHFDVNGVTVGDGASLLLPTRETPRFLNIRVAQDGAPAASYQTSAASLVADGWQPNWTATVEILKNGEILHAFPINSAVAQLTYVDTEPVTGAAYTHTIERDGQFYLNAVSDNPVDPTSLNTGGADFYIVRVVGDNERYAYIGAIWVSAE